jgi:hypothetical protein
MFSYQDYGQHNVEILSRDYKQIVNPRAFFLGGRRGMRTPKHFVNLTGESKNFKNF